MTDDTQEPTDDGESNDAEETEETEETEEIIELREDPELVEKGGQYDERHQEARESANPDDHRDEPPNNS